MMIEVKDFAKTFYVGFMRKPFVASRGISFEVGEREIYGFLGPNGAGKTTTIKALLGLIRADAGELKLLGHDVSSMEWRTKVGYLPEHPTFYDYVTAFELVVWFARLAGMARHEGEKEAKKILERVGLGYAMNRRLRGYSKGMLQRAGIAQALVGDPQLLILDEPMTGLDPMGRREVRQLILELKDEGKTVFYSTHILPDVEMTCDRVAIIHRGAVNKTGRIDEILKETTKGVSVRVSQFDDALAKQWRERFGDKILVEREAAQVEFESADSANAFVRELGETGVRLEMMSPHHDDLETIFMRSMDAEDAVRPREEEG